MNERREEAVGVTIILQLDNKKRGKISDFGQISKTYNSVFGKDKIPKDIKSIKLVSAVILLHNEFSCMCLKVHLLEYKIRLQYNASQCKVWHI